MGTGLILGGVGTFIWLSAHVAESRKKIELTTATALYCVALMLTIAATLFFIGSVGPAS